MSEQQKEQEFKEFLNEKYPASETFKSIQIENLKKRNQAGRGNAIK